MRNPRANYASSFAEVLFVTLAFVTAALVVWSGAFGGPSNVVLRKKTPFVPWKAPNLVPPALQHAKRTEDFVYALFSDPHRMPIVRAGRAWRQGCRTVIATNEIALTAEERAEADLHNEIWIVYPDNTREESSGVADMRGAILPVLAHRVLKGEYKWMLWGDDDTMWFPHGASALLRSWDHTSPHLISDNWWPENRRIPGKNAARCMPCHAHARPGDSVKHGLVKTAHDFLAPVGCPVCTSRMLCENLANFGWHYDEWRAREGDGACDDLSNWPEPTTSEHGGTGMAISVAAAQQVAGTDEFEQCVHDPRGWNRTSYIYGQRWNQGGDAIFMRCMWRAGIGGTDAGTVMEGPLQLVDRLEWWDFRASSSLDMMQHEDFDRGWRRRERKRLFGGISHTNLRELQDMMAQWEDPQLAPQPSCNGDPWCLAELAWVPRIVSSHAKASEAPDLAAHELAMVDLYQSHRQLLQRLGAPLFELPERNDDHSRAPGHLPPSRTVTKLPGSSGAYLAPPQPAEAAEEWATAMQDDLVFALHSAPTRAALVKASRDWRQGCRTVVASSSEDSGEALDAAQAAEALQYNEIWIEYPDNTEEQSANTADFRAAMLPVLAHRAMEGKYKWMVVGRDTTVWFPQGLGRLLPAWNHSLPHAITDNFEREDQREPGHVTPRCLPCHAATAEAVENGTLQATADGFTAVLACPVCTARAVCNTLASPEWFYDDWFSREGPLACGQDPVPWPEPGLAVRDGAGVVLSVGATTMLARSQEYEQCVVDPGGWKQKGRINKQRWNTGAGALLARCLWRAGIAFTDSGAAAVGLPQPAHALEAWEFSEPWKTRHFDRHSEFARGWQRRERKRLFGGAGHSNLREVGDILGQWKDTALEPEAACLGDSWCLAELEWVQRMVSTDGGANSTAEPDDLVPSLRNIYSMYDSLIFRLQDSL